MTDREKLRRLRAKLRVLETALTNLEAMCSHHERVYLSMVGMVSHMLGFPGICRDQQGLRDRLLALLAENSLMRAVLTTAKSPEIKEFGG